MYHETKQEVKAGGMEGMQPKTTNMRMIRMIRMIIQTQATIHTLTIDHWLDLNAWNICYRMSVSGRYSVCMCLVVSGSLLHFILLPEDMLSLFQSARSRYMFSFGNDL